MKKIDEQPQGRRFGWLKNGNSPCDLKSLPRCQATAKSTGRRCGNLAMRDKRVCYLHGGKSPGAPKGNRNAEKHGEYSAEEMDYYRDVIGKVQYWKNFQETFNNPLKGNGK